MLIFFFFLLCFTLATLNYYNVLCLALYLSVIELNELNLSLKDIS